MELCPEDRHLCTINTHKGLCRCNRLLCGIASAPAVWQREIENILKDIPGVAVFLKDITVSGPNNAVHLERLEAVLRRLHKYNIKINADKCEFFEKRINYCGYVIDAEGIHKDQQKMEAIDKMSRPKNITQLRSFIGMINYYSKFIKNLSNILYPLNKLLRADTPFRWDKDCEKSFQNAKKVFQTDICLAHYDPELQLIVGTDASTYGVSAILSQILPDGTERVLQYASDTLTNTKRKYSQIDKEAYAIIFAIKKFHQYLYGLFSPTKGLPFYSTMRMQHYALFLQAFITT